MTGCDESDDVIDDLMAQNEALSGLSDAIECGDWDQARRYSERFDRCATDLRHNLGALSDGHPVRTNPVAVSFATAIADKSRLVSSQLRAAREELSRSHETRMTQREATLAYSSA